MTDGSYGPYVYREEPSACNPYSRGRKTGSDDLDRRPASYNLEDFGRYVSCVEYQQTKIVKSPSRLTYSEFKSLDQTPRTTRLRSSYILKHEIQNGGTLSVRCHHRQSARRRFVFWAPQRPLLSLSQLQKGGWRSVWSKSCHRGRKGQNHWQRQPDRIH